KHIYVQLVDDEKGEILAAASDSELKAKNKKNKTDLAEETGKLIAQKSQALKIKSVIFDRGGHKYHGRVKALAEGAREGGLKF
ncbi:MAG: 50S ribosomal protein L18, partial [bacterium]|nr:50S ribosomal protein L18 [bacterium]